VPDEVASGWPQENQRLAVGSATPPAKVLEDSLHAIAASYGRHTADVVAMQLECPRAATTR
jgi:hypothetical protein